MICIDVICWATNMELASHAPFGRRTCELWVSVIYDSAKLGYVSHAPTGRRIVLILQKGLTGRLLLKNCDMRKFQARQSTGHEIIATSVSNDLPANRVYEVDDQFGLDSH